MRVGEHERKHDHALHGDKRDEQNAVTRQARVANAAVEARRGAQSEEHEQNGEHRARAQRVKIERNLLIERDARHLNCADVREVRHVHLDGMALASGIERDVGSRGVGGVDRHGRVRVVVRVALVGERDDDLDLTVGRLCGTCSIGEHRCEMNGAHRGVEPRDLKGARRRIERDRAHLRRLRPVDEVAPRIGIGHRVEELEVVAEHLERDRQQHADENAYDVVRLAVRTGEHRLGLGCLLGRLRGCGPRRTRGGLLHGGSRSTCRFAAAGNARLRYRPTCAARSVLSRAAGRRRATLACRTCGPRTSRVRTRGPRSRIARGSRARARTRRWRALLSTRATPSVTRLPIFLIFSRELLELGRGMARLERIVFLIVVSHAPSISAMPRSALTSTAPPHQA